MIFRFLLGAIIAACTYLAFGFILLDLNAWNWSETTRGLFVFFMVIIIFIAQLGYTDHSEHEP